MTIDFERLTPNQLEVFSSLREDVINDYNELSSRLLALAPDNICWITSSVTCRNVNHSKMLYYLNCLSYINHCIKNGIKIEKVITRDEILYKTLKNSLKVVFEGRSESKWIYIRHIIMEYLRYIWWCFNAYKAKSNKRRACVINKHHIKIIDTFIAKKGEKYNDRYYNSIINDFPEKERNRTFYLAQYLPLPSRKEVNRIADNSTENIIYLFDFLKLKDYFSSLLIKHKFNKVEIPTCDYKGFGLKFVFGESISRYIVKYYYSSAILYEKFFKRLKEAGVELDLFVDWFENQSYDKSCYYSIHKYYPHAQVHGFIGAIMDFTDFPHNLATNAELHTNIAPHQLYLCNKAMRDAYMASGYKGSLEIAPTFRANKIWSVKHDKKDKNNFVIVVPLGLVAYEVNYKVNFLIEYLKTKPESIRIVIKPHPVYPLEEIKAAIQKNNVEMEIGTGDIYDYLRRADAIVGSNSTTLYEALGFGIPVISIKDDTGQLNIHRPQSVKDEMWYEASDIDLLNKAIENIQRVDSLFFEKEGLRLKEYFFEPIKKDTTYRFFEISE